MKQMWQVFQMTRRYDSNVAWLMLLGFLAPVLVGLGLALWLGEGNGFTIALWVVAGVLAGVLLALIVLGRRAERAAYSQIEGQPGAVGAVLRSGLRGGWVGSEMPVAVNGKTQDAVYRAVGRGGVVLISEGPRHAHAAHARRGARKVAAHPAERADHADLGRPRRGLDRAAPTSRRRCARPRSTLTKPEVLAVSNRLNSLQTHAADPEGHRPDEGAPAARQDALTRSTSQLRHPSQSTDVASSSQARISTVPATLSWRPRWSESQMSAGMTRHEQHRAHDRPPEARASRR